MGHFTAKIFKKNLYICKHLLSTTILCFIGCCPKNAIISDFLMIFLLQNCWLCFVTQILPSVNYPLNQLLWLDLLQKAVFFILVDKIIPFLWIWFHCTIISFMYMLNRIGDKGQPYLTLWLSAYSSDNWLSLLLFCFQSKLLLYFLIIRSIFLCNVPNNMSLCQMLSHNQGILNGLPYYTVFFFFCFISHFILNNGSMQDLPFRNLFRHSKSNFSACAVNFSFNISLQIS
jgi:hypothetical protein